MFVKEGKMWHPCWGFSYNPVSKKCQMHWAWQNVTAGISAQYQRNKRLSTCLQEAHSLLAQSTTAHKHMCTRTHRERHFHCKNMSRTETINTKVLSRGSPPSSSVVKNPPAMQEMWVGSLGWEDPLEEKNGNPLRYSFLENPMDRGAWQDTAHGDRKSVV